MKSKHKDRTPFSQWRRPPGYRPLRVGTPRRLGWRLDAAATRNIEAPAPAEGQEWLPNLSPRWLTAAMWTVVLSGIAMVGCLAFGVPDPPEPPAARPMVAPPELLDPDWPGSVRLHDGRAARYVSDAPDLDHAPEPLLIRDDEEKDHAQPTQPERKD